VRCDGDFAPFGDGPSVNAEAHSAEIVVVGDSDAAATEGETRAGEVGGGERRWRPARNGRGGSGTRSQGTVNVLAVSRNFCLGSDGPTARITQVRQGSPECARGRPSLGTPKVPQNASGVIIGADHLITIATLGLS